MRKLLSLICVLTLGLVVVACGGSDSSDGSSEGKTTTTAAKADKTTTTDGGTPSTVDGDVAGITEDEYTAAFVINLSSGSEANGNLVIPKENAACVAPKFVDAITVETLQENEITVDDIEDPGFDGSSLGMDETQGQALVDAFGACDVDIYGLFAKALTAGLTADQQACTVQNLDKDLANALLVKTFSTGQSDAEFEAVLADLDTKCDLPAN